MGGRKVFTAGEVLTAADTNDYLMDQSVMVFAGTAARASAISAPSEGMVTYLADTDDVEVYTGAAWQSITAGSVTVVGDNLLYNGAMQVAQRGTSTASITTGGYYTADRWQWALSSLGTWTQSVEADGPTGSGLTKSLKFLCTTADAAPAAGDFSIVTQSLEGQDVQRVAKGTASAKQLTISFWVKSNVTGTYVVGLFDDDNTRINSQSYAVSASDTWEKKTVTFPADTTGTLNNDNGASLTVQFWLGGGSNFTSGTLATSWQSNTNANRAVGQTNLAAATNNYWQITGVQLEIGDAATDFEFKSFGQELAECQRYYYQHIGGNPAASGFSSVCAGAVYSATESRGLVQFPVTMRTAPSMVASSGTDHFRISANGASTSFNTLTINGASLTNAIVISSAHSSITAGHGGQIIVGNTSASSLAFTAEL